MLQITNYFSKGFLKSQNIIHIGLCIYHFWYSRSVSVKGVWVHANFLYLLDMPESDFLYSISISLYIIAIHSKLYGQLVRKTQFMMASLGYMVSRYAMIRYSVSIKTQEHARAVSHKENSSLQQRTQKDVLVVYTLIFILVLARIFLLHSNFQQTLQV